MKRSWMLAVVCVLCPTAVRGKRPIPFAADPESLGRLLLAMWRGSITAWGSVGLIGLVCLATAASGQEPSKPAENPLALLAERCAADGGLNSVPRRHAK